MMVFCFDLTVAQLWSERPVKPGFLIHDSSIFDGVDERQVARALMLAARDSEHYGFQYACTLNSDLVPWDELDPNLDLRNAVVLELTDKDETGGLFGTRFG
jgi:uncharacterized protein YydD (DUF2326 family)